MPKRVFWPLALIAMGIVFLASNMGYLPAAFWNLWPLILIIVGLGGLLTSDREEWMSPTRSTSANSTSMAKSSSKKTSKKKK